MTQRQQLLGLMFLSGSLAFAVPAQAQRSGFIIGFGLGPGLASYAFLDLDRQTKLGVATDFHIGGVIGDSFELYFVNKATIVGRGSEGLKGVVVMGVSGVGVTYPLNPDFAVSGAIGIGYWSIVSTDIFANRNLGGLGLLAGGRYQLNERGRWMLNFDIMYARPGGDGPGTEMNVLGAQLTINAMSH